MSKRRRHRERKPLLDKEKPEWEEDEDKENGYSRQSSRCPSCEHMYDIALILPCSHTLCGRCIVAGEGTRPAPSHSRGAALPVCAVLCPCCRHLVELPCWDWASATRCLPHDPSLSPGRATREEGAPEDPLQVSGVPPSLHLSNSSLTVTYQGGSPPGPIADCHGNRVRGSAGVACVLPQVCADVAVTRGQYYWEVDVCNSTAYRIGVSSLDGSGGWWLERRDLSFCAVYDGSLEPLCTVPPQIKTLGVFLNVGGGGLSFYNPLTQEHLATLPTRFSPTGVLPALGLGQGRLRLRCGLPPPPHIFLSRASAYRGPCGASGGRWHRDVPFQSVRTVIQKFENLAVLDSNSTSYSTQAPLSDQGPGHRAFSPPSDPHRFGAGPARTLVI
ncbi:uncharacterized protein ACN63O_000329 [Diretmus argenteus]